MNSWSYGQACDFGCYNVLPNPSFECDTKCGMWTGVPDDNLQAGTTFKWRPMNATPDIFMENCPQSKYAIPSSSFQTIDSAQHGMAVLGLAGGSEDDAVVVDFPNMLPAGNYSLTFWYISAHQVDNSPSSPGNHTLEFYTSDVYISTAPPIFSIPAPFTPPSVVINSSIISLAPSLPGTWTQGSVNIHATAPFSSLIIAHNGANTEKKYIFLDNFQMTLDMKLSQSLTVCHGKDVHLNVPALPQGYLVRWGIPDTSGNVQWTANTTQQFDVLYVDCPTYQGCEYSYVVEVYQLGCPPIRGDIKIKVTPADACGNNYDKTYSHPNDLYADQVYLSSTSPKKIYFNAAWVNGPTPFTFSNDLTFNNCEIYLLSGHQLILQNKARLRFINCSLQTCECFGLWDGFVLHDESELIMTGNNLNATNLPDPDNPTHFIKDAYTAIRYASPLAKINIEGMAFDKNHIHIKIEGGGKDLTNLIHIKNSLFNGNRLNKPWYHGMVHLGLGSLVGLPVKHGFELTDVAGILIARNSFRSVSAYNTAWATYNSPVENVGIYADRSNMTVRNNLFEMMVNPIHAEEEQVGGQTIITNNVFTKYLRGIISFDQSVDIRDNEFTDGLVGVYNQVALPNKSVNIKNNRFLNNRQIAILRFSKAVGDCKMIDNTLLNLGLSDEFSNGAGIVVFGNPKPSILHINNNFMENVTAGITCHFADNPKMLQNTIFANGNDYVDPSSIVKFENTCIFLNECDGGVIEDNILDFYNLTVADKLPHGVVLNETPAVQTLNNTFGNSSVPPVLHLDYGYLVIGKGSTNNILRCNSFYRNKKAIGFINCESSLREIPGDMSTTFGTRPAYRGPGILANNTFSNCLVESSTINTRGDLMKIYVRNSPTNPDMIPDVRYSDVPMRVLNYAYANGSPSCQNVTAQNRNLKGFIQSQTNNLLDDFSKKQDLNRQMLKHVDLTTLDTLHQQYWANAQGSNALALSKAEQALNIGDLNAAQVSLQNLIPDSAEQHYYQVLQAEINQKITGYWTSADSTLLENLSHQLSGNDKAIRRARMLSLGMKHDKFSYIPHFRLDWELQTSTAGKTDIFEETTVEEVTFGDSKFKLYPNPNNGSFQIEGLGCKKYTLSDISGKVLHEGILQSELEKQEIHVKDVPQGLYLLHVQTNAGVQSIKLIIQ